MEVILSIATLLRMPEGTRRSEGFVWDIKRKRQVDTDDTSRVTATNFRHEGRMIKGTVVVAGERENFPVILPVISKRGVAVRSVT